MIDNAPFEILELELVAETDAHEGPVYVAEEDALYFTTLPRDGNVAIKRLDLASREISVLREPANHANGMTLAPDGALIVCEQGDRSQAARISRVDRGTGEAETVIDAYRGLPFNSPNDVVVASDGTIWFTDPSYGHLQGFRPAPQLPDQVYRHDPRTGDTTVAATGFDKPNGLAFSPDEQVLYVGDNGAPQELLAFDLRDGAARRRVAAGTPEHPDGLKVDSEGRIYASASTGIHVFDPTGALLGEITLPGAVIFTFGGLDRNVLFITRDDSIWAAHLDAKGA
jgi:gluconolactonase